MPTIALRHSATQWRTYDQPPPDRQILGHQQTDMGQQLLTCRLNATPRGILSSHNLTANTDRLVAASIRSSRATTNHTTRHRQSSKPLPTLCAGASSCPCCHSSHVTYSRELRRHTLGRLHTYTCAMTHPQVQAAQQVGVFVQTHTHTHVSVAQRRARSHAGLAQHASASRHVCC